MSDRLLEVEAFFYGCTECLCKEYHTKWSGPTGCECCQASNARALAAGKPSHWIKTPERLWPGDRAEAESK